MENKQKEICDSKYYALTKKKDNASLINKGIWANCEHNNCYIKNTTSLYNNHKIILNPIEDPHPYARLSIIIRLNLILTTCIYLKSSRYISI